MALYSIAKQRLDGTGNTVLISNATQEMTHNRVSHSGQYITFTRYWNFVNGLANEDGGYTNTEICRMNADGTNVLTLVPNSPGVINANSSFLPDDSGVIFLSSSQGIVQPLLYTFGDGQTHTLPFPAGITCSDPHWEGPCNQIVFPEIVSGQQDALWTMFQDGTNLQPFTTPRIVQTGTPSFDLGDYDPRLTTDGTKVTWMRYFGGNDFRVLVKGMRPQYGLETDLTGANGGIDAVPEWSGDGQLIIFRHIDPVTPTNQTIQTMNPDGTNRQIVVPVTGGQLFNHPSFFLGEGSVGTTHVLYGIRQ